MPSTCGATPSPSLALLSSPQPAASAFSLGGPSRPLRTAAARSTRLQVGGVYRDFVDDAQASDGKGRPGQGRISTGFEGRMRDRFMKQKRQQYRLPIPGFCFSRVSAKQ